MRTPSLVLCAGNGDEEHLLHCIRMGCIPTHHTSQAISAAAAYGFALRALLDGKEIPEVLEAAERGAKKGYASLEYVAAAPDCIARLKKIQEDLKEDSSDERIRHLLYYVYGNGLESIDAFCVAMTVFLAKGKDVFGALKLCASLGGDTDTVGALTGALCAAYAGGHNIPADLIQTVVANNHLDLEEVANGIENTFWK
jgi:ADP-ribosylglycohydrolase